MPCWHHRAPAVPAERGAQRRHVVAVGAHDHLAHAGRGERRVTLVAHPLGRRFRAAPRQHIAAVEQHRAPLLRSRQRDPAAIRQRSLAPVLERDRGHFVPRRESLERSLPARREKIRQHHDQRAALEQRAGARAARRRGRCRCPPARARRAPAPRRTRAAARVRAESPARCDRQTRAARRGPAAAPRRARAARRPRRRAPTWVPDRRPRSTATGRRRAAGSARASRCRA